MSLERNCHNNQKSTWLLKNDQLFSTLSSSSQVTVGGSHNNRDLQLTDIINTLFFCRSRQNTISRFSKTNVQEREASYRYKLDGCLSSI